MVEYGEDKERTAVAGIARPSLASEHIPDRWLHQMTVLCRDYGRHYVNLARCARCNVEMCVAWPAVNGNTTASVKCPICKSSMVEVPTARAMSQARANEIAAAFGTKPLEL